MFFINYLVIFHSFTTPFGVCANHKIVVCNGKLQVLTAWPSRYCNTRKIRKRGSVSVWWLMDAWSFSNLQCITLCTGDYMINRFWLCDCWKFISADVCLSTTPASLDTAIHFNHCFSVCCPLQQRRPPPSLCVCPSAALPARRCVFEAVPLAHSDAYRWRQMALTAGLPLTPLILILLLLLLLLVSPSNCHYEDAPNVGSYAQNLLRYWKGFTLTVPSSVT